MPRYDLEILIRQKKVGDGIPESEKDVENFGKRLNNVLGVIEKSTAAAIAAGAVFKKAFDLGSEGASLNQLTDSFNDFNKSILKTPNLLDDIRKASGGVIAESDLMSGLLTLTAGASDDYARGLAAVYPNLVEIARASNKLNPALGDTSFLLQSLTTAAKRQSVPIADNLGLIIKMDNAVRKVHPSLQNLATDYNGLTQQQKFLNELLFQGDQLINQVGGSVDSQTDSWQRLGVMVEEATNQFKQWLADGLLPTINALSGAADDSIKAVTDSTIQQAASVEDLTAALTKAHESWRLSRTLLGGMTGTTDQVNSSVGDMIKAIAASSSSYDEFMKAVKAAGFSTAELNTLLEANGDIQHQAYRDNETGIQGYYELARALQEAASADAILTRGLVEKTEVSRRQGPINEELLEQAERRSNLLSDEEQAIKRANLANQTYFDNQKKQKALTEEHLANRQKYLESLAREAELAKAAASATGDFFTDAITDADKALASFVTTYVAYGGATEDQAQLLGELSDEYEKVQSNILSYQSGVKGLGLTEDERNEKLGEQYERLAQIEQAMGALNVTAASYSVTSQGVVVNTEALNTAFFNMLDDAGATAEELGNAALRLDLWSEAEVRAALESARLEAGLTAIKEAFANGNLTIDEALNAYELFANGSVSTAENAIILAQGVDEVTGSAVAARDRMLELEGVVNGFSDKTFTYHFKVTTEGAPPSFPDAAGQTTSGNVFGATGIKDLTVPPGFPNDTFAVMASSGERVNVETPAQQKANDNGGNSGPPMIFNINLYGSNATPEAIMSFVSSKLAPRG